MEIAESKVFKNFTTSVPKAILHALNLEPNDRLAWIVANGRVEVRKKEVNP